MNTELEKYAEKVSLLMDGAYPCRHGHLGCAAWECGPCLDHLLIESDELNEELA